MIHHRKQNRMRGFDYTYDRMYFITSCVEHRACVFLDIVPIDKLTTVKSTYSQYTATHRMVLIPCGSIADQQWYWLEQQYPYIHIHAFIVMPNHVHGIIEINQKLIPIADSFACHVGTGRDLSLHDRPTPVQPIKIKSLSELIGAYKTTSSKQIHLWEAPDGTHPYHAFHWQRSFHDHIIRNQKEYDEITAYIHKNPSAWDTDLFYK